MSTPGTPSNLRNDPLLASTPSSMSTQSTPSNTHLSLSLLGTSSTPSSTLSSSGGSSHFTFTSSSITVTSPPSSMLNVPSSPTVPSSQHFSGLSHPSSPIPTSPGGGRINLHNSHGVRKLSDLNQTAPILSLPIRSPMNNSGSNPPSVPASPNPNSANSSAHHHLPPIHHHTPSTSSANGFGLPPSYHYSSSSSSSTPAWQAPSMLSTPSTPSSLSLSTPNNSNGSNANVGIGSVDISLTFNDALSPPTSPEPPRTIHPALIAAHAATSSAHSSLNAGGTSANGSLTVPTGSFLPMRKGSFRSGSGQLPPIHPPQSPLPHHNQNIPSNPNLAELLGNLPTTPNHSSPLTLTIPGGSHSRSPSSNPTPYTPSSSDSSSILSSPPRGVVHTPSSTSTPNNNLHSPSLTPSSSASSTPSSTPPLTSSNNVTSPPPSLTLTSSGSSSGLTNSATPSSPLLPSGTPVMITNMSASTVAARSPDNVEGETDSNSLNTISGGSSGSTGSDHSSSSAVHSEEKKKALAEEEEKRARYRKAKGHRNSIVQYIDSVRRAHTQQLTYLKQKAMLSDPSLLTSQRVIYLPRGGTYVQTSSGPLQFGLPPETIKDSMNLGLTLPTNFVLPKERFNLQMGMNVAEFEFPAYYNFFIKRRRINIITTREVEPLIRTIFQQTLLGPEHIEFPTEYSEEVPKECYPVNPFDRTPLTIDTLLQFTFFEDGIARISPDVEIHDKGEEYVIYDRVAPPDPNGPPPATSTSSTTSSNTSTTPSSTPPTTGPTPSESKGEGKLLEVGRVSCYVMVSPPGEEDIRKDDGKEIKEYFVPPHFGITMLGNSDGFDKGGTTTGFVLWMNRRGIMVDPPPHSGFHLRKHGINPRLIKGVILSHCHADHDAGTFQKILEEGRVVVMTSDVILASFLKKYSAISGLKEEFLRKLFLFRPIIIGEKTAVYGGHIQFFYALHSIPCVGFAAYCNGKSMVYSADSYNDPPGIHKFFEKGLMTEGRRDKLLNFPWHHTVILHEAGVPPIHTPLTTLEALSEDIKRRLYIVHKPSKDVPTDKGLKSALVGPENTIVISQEEAPSSKALEILDLVSSIDFFSNFVVSRGMEFIQCAQYQSFKPGDILIAEGTPGSTMYIVSMGVVSISIGGKFLKTMTVGDHFGEMSIVTGEPRTATITAVTNVECVRFPKNEFLYLVRRTNAIERMKQLGAMQRSKSWQVINSNSVLTRLTTSQKTYLQSILLQRSCNPGEPVWIQGQEATEAVLVGSGKFAFARAQDLQPFSSGAFVGDMQALLNGTPLTTTLICAKQGVIYYVTKKNLLKFLDENPGIKVFFMNRRFVE